MKKFCEKVQQKAIFFPYAFCKELLNKRSGGFNKPNHLFVILPGEQKGTTGEATNGTTVGAKKAPLTVHKGPTNYYNKTLDETTYTYDEGESF